MARVEVTNSKNGVNTANTIMWQIKTAAAGRIWIYEVGLSVLVQPTTGPAWRLVRATAVGTSSATATPQTVDPSTAAATSVLDTAWSVTPTLAANDHRGYATPNTIGSGIVWTWYDKPFVVAASSGLCLVNGNAVGATLGTFRVYACYDE